MPLPAIAALTSTQQRKRQDRTTHPRAAKAKTCLWTTNPTQALIAPDARCYRKTTVANWASENIHAGPAGALDPAPKLASKKCLLELPKLVNTIDNPATRNVPRRHVYQPHGGHRPGLHQPRCPQPQPGPGEHDPRNDVLTRATRAEDLKHRKYDATCAATGSHFSPFALETTGGHWASTATVNLLFAKLLRDSGLPADVLAGKLNKDISFALRRGTTAQVTTHALDGYACPARGRG